MNFLEMLQQKEVSLLEAIQKSPAASQRFLSSSLGLSLGQVNSIIKTLVRKGDLELTRKNGREVKYEITKRGYGRWMRSSTSRLSDAFHHICDVKRCIGNILDSCFAKGVREFVIEGENETIAALVGEVFRETFADEAKLIWGPAKENKENKGQIILKVDGVDAAPDDGIVHVLHELANAG